MKKFLSSMLLVLCAGRSYALNPQMTCESQRERSRYFEVAIFYSPLNQLTTAQVNFKSEYGNELVTHVSLKRPGYSSGFVYFNEQPYSIPGLPTPPISVPTTPGGPSIPTFPGTLPGLPPLPPVKMEHPFQLVVSRATLIGDLEFVTYHGAKFEAKVHKLKVKCTEHKY